MNREEILQASKEENNNKDIAGIEFAEGGIHIGWLDYPASNPLVPAILPTAAIVVQWIRKAVSLCPRLFL